VGGAGCPAISCPGGGGRGDGASWATAGSRIAAGEGGLAPRIGRLPQLEQCTMRQELSYVDSQPVEGCGSGGGPGDGESGDPPSHESSSRQTAPPSLLEMPGMPPPAWHVEMQRRCSAGAAPVQRRCSAREWKALRVLRLLHLRQ
jgi:hypothetical protein